MLNGPICSILVVESAAACSLERESVALGGSIGDASKMMLSLGY